jgi:hypothetical protein
MTAANPTRVPPKTPPKTVEEIARPLPLSEPAKARIPQATTPRALLDLLIADGLIDDAIRILAHALPKREAVGWGCLCVRPSFGPQTLPPEIEAIEAAELWVKDPSEPNRRGAGKASESADVSTAAGCLAVSAFWSGGSLAPPNLPAVPPRDDLTAQAVAGAIMMASVVVPVETAKRRREFLTIGMDVASGKIRPAG